MDYRHDLHQIFGYASFDIHSEKQTILCYPSNKLGMTETAYLNQINQTKNKVKILGIPLHADVMSKTKQYVIENVLQFE